MMNSEEYFLKLNMLMMQCHSVSLIVILVGVASVQAAWASECRNAQKEGWAWADSSLTYSIDDGQEPLDFSSIHGVLRQTHQTLLNMLEDKTSNICVAQLNLVIKQNGGGQPVIFALPSYPQKHPIKPMVFVSGGAAPDFTLARSYIPKEDKGILRRLHPLYEYREKGRSLFEGLTIFHPGSEFFLRLTEIVKRLNKRYKDIDTQELPIKAQLGRRWEELVARVAQTADDKIVLRKEKEEWYRDATSPSSYHLDKIGEAVSGNDMTDQKISSDSNEIFFTHNADSEQKLFYCFQCMTDSVEGFIQLREIIKKIKLFAHAKYRIALINGLMRHANSQTDKIREALKAEKQTDSVPKKEDIDAAFKELVDYFSRDDVEKKARFNRIFLDLLMDITKKARAQFDEIVKLDEEEKLDPKSITNGAHTEADRQDNLLKLLSKFLPTVDNRPEPLVDEAIDQFNKLVAECLQAHHDYYIYALVLNVHSTNDICHSCAPDLAQEIWSTDNFVDYFVRTITQKNPAKQVPIFRTIYSCGKIREDKRCPQCIRRKCRKCPRFKAPSKRTAYYQHYFPPQDDPDKDGQTATRVDSVQQHVAVSSVDNHAKSHNKEEVSKGGRNEPLKGVLGGKNHRSRDSEKSSDEHNDVVAHQTKKKVPDHSRGPRVVEDHKTNSADTKQRLKREPLFINENVKSTVRENVNDDED